MIRALALAAAFAVPCSQPGTWPHTADAAWLGRVLARAGYAHPGCTGSAFVIDTGRDDLYVWTVRSRALGGYRFNRSVQVAGVRVRADRIRAAWRARRRPVWVWVEAGPTTRQLPPLPRLRRLVRATRI